jgi:hypothetical protein
MPSYEGSAHTVITLMEGGTLGGGEELAGVGHHDMGGRRVKKYVMDTNFINSDLDKILQRRHIKHV